MSVTVTFDGGRASREYLEKLKKRFGDPLSVTDDDGLYALWTGADPDFVNQLLEGLADDTILEITISKSED